MWWYKFERQIRNAWVILQFHVRSQIERTLGEKHEFYECEAQLIKRTLFLYK
jgi:hypothetical protein